MKKSTKAVLLSAFVFPGAGHFLLKQYISSAIIAGTAFAVLYFIVTKTVDRALQITEKIQSGEVQLDITTITELVSKQSAGPETQLLNIAETVLIILWIIGIADAYRVGRLQDKKADVLANS